MTSRQCSHAGSWYESKGAVLSSQIQSWLDQAGKDPLINQINQSINQSDSRSVKALIAPHAGYSYSGPTAAYAYQSINQCLKQAPIDTIFILGPSHHHYTKKCELTKSAKYITPMGDLTINQSINKQLFDTGLFDWMDEQTDEDEHSIEMHLPYIKHAINQVQAERAKANQSTNQSTSQSSQSTNQSTNQQFPDIQIVPVLVGSLTQSQIELMGEVLVPYYKDPRKIFIISSDFCHWGVRFRYTYYDPQYATIGECIESLDRLGMSLIEAKDSRSFEEYDMQFRNTICGRHPIAILLNIIDRLDTEEQNRTQVRFVKYAQSQSVKSKAESSVSYAAAIIWQE